MEESTNIYQIYWLEFFMCIYQNVIINKNKCRLIKVKNVKKIAEVIFWMKPKIETKVWTLIRSLDTKL